MPTRTRKAERLLNNARIIIPVGFLLVLAAVIAVMLGLIRSRAADEMVVHTFEVQQAAQAVLINVRDAETTKRSYLLTGESDYLESVAAAMQTIPIELGRLSDLVSDNPERQKDVRNSARSSTPSLRNCATR